MMKNIQRKVCLLGDFAVGKTSLVRRFVYNKFSANYLATIGVQISRKDILVSGKVPTQLGMVIWDLAGGETLTRTEEAYYRGGTGALLIADITRPETFSILNTYATTFLQINPGASLVIACNKMDLVTDASVQTQKAAELAARWNAPLFMTSSLTGEGVKDLFIKLAHLLVGVK